MKNWVPIFIAIVLVLASSPITMADDHEVDGTLFQWPSFTNNHHASIIKKVHCSASIHHVYKCLRSSFVIIPNHHHKLHHASATDCCTAIADFRDKCGDLGVGKLESVIFPAVLFKQCSAGDQPASAPADGPAAADIEV